MHAGDSAAFAAILLLLLLVVAAGARRLWRHAPRPLPGRAPAPSPRRKDAPALPAAPAAAGASDSGPLPEPIAADASPPEPASAPESAPELASAIASDIASDGASDDASDVDDRTPPAPLALWVERPLVWIPPPRRGKTRHPVLLAHGFAGFDVVEISGLRFAYFRGIEDRLRAAGVEVHVLRVSPIASIAQRARQLAEQVRQLPGGRFNIVAHSMGGLDARYALTTLGLGDRVASLTTIGTPHRGTPLADLGISLLGGTLGRAFGRMGVPLDAFHDLTTARMQVFNQEARDAPGVVYNCFVASAREVNAVLVPAHRLLHRLAGENDGIVPASSQRWGEVLGEIDADHWGAIGWSSRFDAGAFYERLALDLGDRGL